MISFGRRVASVLIVVGAVALIIYAGVHFLSVTTQAAAASGSASTGMNGTGSTVAESTTTESDLPATSTTASQEVAWGTCRKGVVNDPYPGLCHDYVDSNGDGICDLSQSDPNASAAATLVAATGGSDGVLIGGCPFGLCAACGACFS